jgi:peptidoglycan/xylan/chitin deacetylase (PgdA/CDA1 family)
MNSFLRLCVAASTLLFLLPGMAPAKAQNPPRPATASAVVPDPLAPPAPDSTDLAPATHEPSAIATPPPARAPRKPTYNSVKTTEPVVALTFDDGPHPTLTPRLLDMLKERGVKATFYVIGQEVVRFPEIVQRMVAEGHEIGNHTHTHPSLPKIGSARVGEEISKSNAAIEQAVGVRPTTMRPPYGAINPAITKRLNEEFDLPVILWSVDPQDWKIRKASHVSNHMLQNAHPGAILLAHDIHASTIDAMPAVLDGLAAKGYRFATVSELIALDGKATEPTAPASAPLPTDPAPPETAGPAPAAVPTGTL